VYFKNVNEEML